MLALLPRPYSVWMRRPSRLCAGTLPIRIVVCHSNLPVASLPRLTDFLAAPAERTAIFAELRCQPERGADPDQQPDRHQRHALNQHHIPHRARLRAQREASSSSSRIFPNKNNASAFSNASMSRRRTGNWAWPTSRRGNTGGSTRTHPVESLAGRYGRLAFSCLTLDLIFLRPPVRR